MNLHLTSTKHTYSSRTKRENAMDLEGELICYIRLFLTAKNEQLYQNFFFGDL